jgi:2-oxoglutarate dehydrogenase E2 component (dihydrolipoamide succinyltransferase)
MAEERGRQVSVGEPLVELETDKVDLEVGATQEGILAKIMAPTGQDVKVGDILGTIDAGQVEGRPAQQGTPEAATSRQAETEPERTEIQAEAGPPSPTTPKTPEIPSETGQAGSEEKITPVARRLAEEHGLDLAKIMPGDGGRRITRKDVERYLDEQPPAVSGKKEELEPVIPQISPSAQLDRPEEHIRMSRRRRTIAQRLVEAQQTAAMLTTFNDVDMSAVMALRQRRKEAFQERYGVKLGIMSFFVKAAVGALKAFPKLNGEIRNDEIVLKHYFDIGIAVGAEEGLVVPVLRDADKLSFAEVEQKINEFVEKARSGTLSLEDLRGGTFSITNGGVFGSLLSTPILNPPQSGILGMHRIEERPVARDGQVVIRPMMYLALTYDHRMVDGREAVQFLVRLKEFIEDPESLLLEG